jgi:hypothetical protein
VPAVTSATVLAATAALVHHNISAGTVVAILAIAAVVVTVLVIAVSFTLSRRGPRHDDGPGAPGAPPRTSTLGRNPPLRANPGSDRPAG